MDATEEFSEAPNPFTPTAPSNYKKQLQRNEVPAPGQCSLSGPHYPLKFMRCCRARDGEEFLRPLAALHRNR